MSELEELRLIVRTQSRLISALFELLEAPPTGLDLQDAADWIDAAFDGVPTSVADRWFPELAERYPILRDTEG